MKNKIIIYKSDLDSAVKAYLDSYDKTKFNNNSAYVILPPEKKGLIPLFKAVIDDFPCTPLNSDNNNSNRALGHIYSSTAPELGGVQYSSYHKPALFLLVQPTVIEMYFLKSYLNEVDATIHLFMKEESYKSNNLVESLKDYIPFMDFEEIYI